MRWAKRSTRVLTGREKCITLSLTESHSNTARLPPFFSHSHFSKSSVRERSWSSKSEKRRSGKSARTRFLERVSMQKKSFREKSALLVAPPIQKSTFSKQQILWLFEAIKSSHPGISRVYLPLFCFLLDPNQTQKQTKQNCITTADYLYLLVVAKLTLTKRGTHFLTLEKQIWTQTTTALRETSM